jgi:hypothetical protein
MKKPVLVVTHERSGTHLLINIINYDCDGHFRTIGWMPNNELPFTLDKYKHTYYRDIMSNAYRQGEVCKSHHQVEFSLPYIDFILENYKIIYVKRDVKDVLFSYHKFISTSVDSTNFTSLEEWIFSKPDDVAKKFINPYFPDPHVIVEPDTYIDRWKKHLDGWMKFENDILVVSYEEILGNYNEVKPKIENWVGKKVVDDLKILNNPKYPNFKPNKGIVGEYKEVMSDDLIKKIEELI